MYLTARGSSVLTWTDLFGVGRSDDHRSADECLGPSPGVPVASTVAENSPVKIAINRFCSGLSLMSGVVFRCFHFESLFLISALILWDLSGWFGTFWCLTKKPV